MKSAQQIESETRRKEVGLSAQGGGKAQNLFVNTKPNVSIAIKEGGIGGKINEIISMRTIMLCRETAMGIQREGLTRRLSDAEFQAKRKEGLWFGEEAI